MGFFEPYSPGVYALGEASCLLVAVTCCAYVCSLDKGTGITSSFNDKNLPA